MPSVFLRVASLAVLAFFIAPLPLRADPPAALPAADLAEVLGIYWWEIAPPLGLGPKDEVVVGFFSAEGRLVFGASIDDSLRQGPVRIFCWEDRVKGAALLAVKSPATRQTSTTPTVDYFKDATQIWNADCGKTVKPGEPLLTFKPSGVSLKVLVRPKSGL